MANTTSPRVWLITGCAHGFGLELMRSALERGDSVVATSRTPEKVSASFKDASDRLLALPMDIHDPKAIAGTIQKAIDRFHRIDVLVNNAGYGLLGAVEEASDEEIAAQFDINVFGLFRITKAVLPWLRKQKSGHIVNISSIGGLIGMAGWGYYNATKFAINGFSEALAQEVGPLGIRVTVVEPGPFRTDFLHAVTSAAKTISDYEQTAGLTRNYAAERDGNQVGDPAKAAQAIVQAVYAQKPPRHLLLGAMAYERAMEHLDEMRAEFMLWRDVTLSSDFNE